MNAQFERLVAEQAKIEGTVLLRYSQFTSVNFLAATVGESLECDGTHLANPGATSLLAERATIKGSVFLRIGNRNAGRSGPPELVPFQAEGLVNLLGATIHGNLVCDGARLSHPPDKTALLLVDGCKITGNAFLQNGFTADGTVDFQGANVQDTFFWVNVNVLPTTILKLQSAKLGTLHGHKETWPASGNLGLGRPGLRSH